MNVKCKANQLGQHKVVIIVLYYHEGLSKQVGDEWALEWHPVEIHLKINNPELQGHH